MQTPRVLPVSVRFAAQHKHGMVGVEEIGDLLNAGFIDEAIPLILEAYALDLNAQEEFVEGLLPYVWKNSADVALCAYLAEALDALPPECRVPARKLIEMSWCGFMARGKMELCAAVNWVEARVPVFVGYDSVVALVPFIRHGSAFYMMFPQEDREIWGYEFYPTPESHKVLPMFGRETRETKVSILFFPDRAGYQDAEQLKADFESHHPCNIILESVLG